MRPFHRFSFTNPQRVFGFNRERKRVNEIIHSRIIKLVMSGNAEERGNRKLEVVAF